MTYKITFTINELYTELKTQFKQASSVRKKAESICVTAKRNNTTGYGEGCPRLYVTNEDVPSSIQWLRSIIHEIENTCTDLTNLKNWINENSAAIDLHPAAFCAVETALLDLFAREHKISVEHLLKLPPAKRTFHYTAVLGDSNAEKFNKVLDFYIAAGFTDFKIKINGNLQEDNFKLKSVWQKTSENKQEVRIRMDANNLWQENVSAAIEHLKNLRFPWFAIEEPFKPFSAKNLSKTSKELNKAVILDESLCKMADLQLYKNLAGKFIANIKVSRVGGVIRALDLVKSLKKLNWPIIVGAHVGETSVLTRAAHCVAIAAAENCIAQEGAFGLHLLSYDPFSPSLMFGKKGILDLTKPYVLQKETETLEFPPEQWNLGWGLQP